MKVVAHPSADQVLKRALDRANYSSAELRKALDDLTDAIAKSPMEEDLKASTLKEVEVLRASLEKLLQQ